MSDKQVAVITGGASGIGRACAERLAQDGWSVVISYRSRTNDADEMMKSLEGGPHLAIQGDLSDPSAAASLIDESVKKLGRVDLLVNAAGIYEGHDIASISYEEWQAAWARDLAINLVAPANLSWCVSRPMIKQKRGKIINITSRGAFRGEPGAPAYGASKSGLNSTSQSLARKLAPHGISVFAIAPGWVETPMGDPHLNGPQGNELRAQSPMARAGTADEIANVVAFLAGDGTEYVTGAIIDVNGASYLRN